MSATTLTALFHAQSGNVCSVSKHIVSVHSALVIATASTLVCSNTIVLLTGTASATSRSRKLAELVAHYQFNDANAIEVAYEAAADYCNNIHANHTT
jgi:hypothetical protein